MNHDQVMGLVRIALAVLGTVAVNAGVVSAADWATLTTALVTIIGSAIVIVPIIWTIIAHTKQAKLLSVASMPEVKQIVTDQVTATATPSDKVVTK